MLGVTVGVGDGFREMAKDAAKRMTKHTGLNCVVLDEAHMKEAGVDHPLLLRFKLFELFPEETDIFHFDADITCLQDWDPLQYAGGPLTVVRDLIYGEWIAKDIQVSKFKIDIEKYFNAGLFIANRDKHEEYFRIALKLFYFYVKKHSNMLDQTAMNITAQLMDLDVRYLDRRYNWVQYSNYWLDEGYNIINAHKFRPDDPIGKKPDMIEIDYDRNRYEAKDYPIEINEEDFTKYAGSYESIDGTVYSFEDDGTILNGSIDLGHWLPVEGKILMCGYHRKEYVTETLRLVGDVWVGKSLKLTTKVKKETVPIPLEHKAEIDKYRRLSQEAIRTCPEYPEGKYSGRGIVICAGGIKYFPCAWVCIQMLRKFGCNLPIEVWCLGEAEMDDKMADLLRSLGASVVDASKMTEKYPVRKPLGGWELNPYSIIHSKFEEVLFLDADNVVTLNPEYLFDSKQYRETGSIFWPDYGRLGEDRVIWTLCNVPYRDEPEFESGQIFVNKRKCWKELHLTMHLNNHSDVYYRHIHGDKDTYHMAWHMLETEYSMPSKGIHALDSTMCQHDFYGNRIFQHRNMDKWSFFGENKRIAGFMYEKECLEYLESLRAFWDGDIGVKPLSKETDPLIKKEGNSLLGRTFKYIREGYDNRAMSFLENGYVGTGKEGMETVWWITVEGGVATLHLGESVANPTCSLKKDNHGVWRGRWIRFEQMPITLRELA